MIQMTQVETLYCNLGRNRIRRWAFDATKKKGSFYSRILYILKTRNMMFHLFRSQIFFSLHFRFRGLFMAFQILESTYVSFCILCTSYIKVMSFFSYLNSKRKL